MTRRFWRWLLGGVRQWAGLGLFDPELEAWLAERAGVRSGPVERSGGDSDA